MIFLANFYNIRRKVSLNAGNKLILMIHTNHIRLRSKNPNERLQTIILCPRKRHKKEILKEIKKLQDRRRKMDNAVKKDKAGFLFDEAHWH
jgi:hypothetical protein